MGEILADPVKLPMLIVLVVLEVPALIGLIWCWIRACKKAGNREENKLADTDLP